MQFYWKSTCSTCRNARRLLRELGVQPDEREMGKQPLSVEELDRLIGERPVAQFLNTRNEFYRARDMKRQPPTREEAIRLMAENVNLIRRPLLVDGDDIVFGCDETAYRTLLERTGL
jgi:Spx/MgsR family transcriptional regulator